MLERLISFLAIDSDLAGSSISGTVAESLVHPRKGRAFLSHFVRALSVGWLLATFVTPAISERLNLSKVESLAIAFLGGYAGVRLLDTAEKVALEKIKSSSKNNSDS